MIKKFNDFILNEDGDGGGVANATLGNTGGMGDVVSPTVSAIPGDVAGSTPGSGDIAAHPIKPAFKYPANKKKKKSSIDSRHFGTAESKENMYITKYTDWSNESVDESTKKMEEYKETKKFD
jgi:hypothetical protein